MAAYRQDSYKNTDWDADGFYAERANQVNAADQYIGEASSFDYTTWVTVQDYSPPQNEAPSVSLKQLTSPAPYVFDSSKN